MRIHTNDNTDIDISEDFNLSIVQNNPLMSDQGTMSLPAVLPLSGKNKAVFDHPDQLSRVYKTKLRKPLYVEHGVYQKPTTFVLESVTSEGFDGTFLLNESEMYNKMQEVELSQAFQIRRYAKDMHVPESVTDDIERMILYLERVMVGSFQDVFLLFPVLTDLYEKVFDSGGLAERTKQMYNMLNEQYGTFDGEIEDISLLDPEGLRYYKLKGRTERQYYDSNHVDEGYPVPPGYGITPFLRERYVLQRIFQYFGYTLQDYSLMIGEGPWNNEVVLNNTADALLGSDENGGYIDYSVLVPNGTIKDFLDTVRDKYGCEFFVSADRRTVELKTWNYILAQLPKADITEQISEVVSKTYITPKQFKLTFQRSNEKANVTFDTKQKFEKFYNTTLKYTTLDPYFPSLWLLIPQDAGFYYIQRLSEIWQLAPEPVYIDGIPRQNWSFICTALFDYYDEKNDDMDWEERSSNAEYVPLQSVTIHPDILWTRFPDHYYVPFITERRHKYSELTETVSNNDIVTTSVITDSNADCPIMFCYWLGRGRINSYDPYSNFRVHGTPFAYHTDGSPLPGYFDLIPGGDNGFFVNFWSRYAEIIRHSFHQVTLNQNMNEGEVVNFSMGEYVLCEGQPLLPETLEYTIDKDAIKVSKVVYRTLKIYKDPE